MDDGRTLSLDSCVVAWLRDVRHFVELECSSILLAKSILPRSNLHNSSDFLNSTLTISSTTQKVTGTKKVTDDHDGELIISGRISIESTNSMDEENYDFKEFNKKFEKTNSKHRQIHCSRPSSTNELDATTFVFHEGSKSTPNYDDSSLDSACGSSPIFSSGDSPLRTSSPINHQGKLTFIKPADFMFLPSYLNAKSSIERILTMSNRIFSCFSKTAANNLSIKNENVTNKEIREFVNMMEATAILLIPLKEMEKTKQCITIYEKQPFFDELRNLENATKKLIHKVHCQLVKVIKADNTLVSANIVVHYLSECRPSLDKNLDDALNHLTHLALFSQLVCMEAAQCGAVNNLARILKSNATSECRRLALRSLAVLCSVSKGCLQLFSVGGIDLIARLLYSSNDRCAIEAAGVLTQLTAPSHSFAQWPSNMPKIVIRLLELCDHCENSNSFLLCSAALANLSVQHTSVSELLYKHNAVQKFCRLYCSFAHNSVFAQDQIATVFARLSANGYERALVTQGAVPCLLALLQFRNRQHVELAKKIRSKAAVCIGTLGSNSFGLQAIYEHKGMSALRKAIKIELHCDQQNPVVMICNSVIANLLKKYRQESAV